MRSARDRLGSGSLKTSFERPTALGERSARHVLESPLPVFAEIVRSRHPPPNDVTNRQLRRVAAAVYVCNPASSGRQTDFCLQENGAPERKNGQFPRAVGKKTSSPRAPRRHPNVGDGAVFPWLQHLGQRMRACEMRVAVRWCRRTPSVSSLRAGHPLRRQREFVRFWPARPCGRVAWSSWRPPRPTMRLPMAPHVALNDFGRSCASCWVRRLASVRARH